MDSTTALIWFVFLFLIILLIVSTLKTGYNWYKSNRTVVLIALAATVILTFIILAMSWRSSSEDNLGDDILKDTDSTRDDVSFDKMGEGSDPSDSTYDDSIPEKIARVVEIENTGKLLTTVTWEQFKDLSMQPEFHAKFAKSVKECCIIKKAKYLKYMNVLKKEQSPGFLGGFGGGNIQAPEARTAATIAEIQKIIPLIDSHLASVNPTQIKHRMAKVIRLGESLVAREEVKDLIAQRLYVFNDNPRIFLNHFQNMCLLGPSGVGKTKLAETISEIFATSGILVRNNFISKTGDEFVTAYVGESGPLTRKMLMQSLEGVLFIDEAYSIAPEHGAFVTHNHGKQAIDAMVNHLDKTLGLSFVIAAGYKRDMEGRFLGANEGMPRRFPHRVELSPYTSAQLFQLAMRFLQKDKIVLNSKGREYLYSSIYYIHKNHPKLFERQAGDLLNLTEKIAHYTFSIPSDTSEKDYTKIISEAIFDFSKNQGKPIRLDSDFA